MEKAKPRRIGAIEVGFRLVRVLEAADGPLSLKALSERAGMLPSKSHAYVASFVHEGVIAQDVSTGHYCLGPFAMSLGVAALRQSDLIEIGRRESVAASEATTCSVMLATWGNRGPTIVYRLDGKRRGPTTVRVGYVLPVWRSATGRVFVAHLPQRETAELLQAEEGALSGYAIEAEIAQIRRAGFALSGDADNFSGIASPVFDHESHLVAALTLSRPFDENTHAQRVALGDVVRSVAARISEQLGYGKTLRRREA